MITHILPLEKQLKNPTQTAILWKLRTGRAYTSIELARNANLSNLEIQAYLNKLIQADLIMEIGRRKRAYYRLKNDSVREALYSHYKKSGFTDG